MFLRLQKNITTVNVNNRFESADMWINESNYRLAKLKKKTDFFRAKKVAIYGTGDNAKALLNQLPDLAVSAVVDDYKVGQLFSGHNVISISEAVNRKIQVIIIAAEEESAIKVIDRIQTTCEANNIVLFNMYGMKVSEKNNTKKFDLAEFKERTKFKSVIVFQMDGIMSQFVWGNYEDELKNYLRLKCDEKTIDERLKAEYSYYNIREPYSLWNIYETMQTCLELNDIDIKNIYESEIIWWLQNIKLDTEIIEAIDYCIDNQKIVQIYSELIIPSESLKPYFNKESAGEKIEIINSFEVGLTLSNGLLRKALDKYEGKDILYVGDSEHAASSLAKSYGYETYIVERNFEKHINRISQECFYKDDITSEIQLRNDKVVIVCSDRAPEIDSDAGSKTIYSYIKLMLEKGIDVIFLTKDYYVKRRYGYFLKKIGVIVLEGEHWKKQLPKWLSNNSEKVLFAWLNYPTASMHFINLMHECNIKTVYYGHDLHYQRKMKEYKATNNIEALNESNRIKETERLLINSADITLYPSQAEIEIVQKKFSPKAVGVLTPFFYDDSYKEKQYSAKEREGIMFVGGYRHSPNVDAVKWFLNNIYKIIKERRNIPFYIIGSNEPKELTDIKMDGVYHVGKVTEQELEQYYNKIRMIVAPLRYGAGVKGKITDALYYNVPIVTTTCGIDGIPEAEQFIAYDDDEIGFAEKVLELYGDEKELNKTASNYKILISKYYSKDSAWNNIEKLFF